MDVAIDDLPLFPGFGFQLFVKMQKIYFPDFAYFNTSISYIFDKQSESETWKLGQHTDRQIQFSIIIVSEGKSIFWFRFSNVWWRRCVRAVAACSCGNVFRAAGVQYRLPVSHEKCSTLWFY